MMARFGYGAIFEGSVEKEMKEAKDEKKEKKKTGLSSSQPTETES